jgi:cytoskeleton protein RodZ
MTDELTPQPSILEPIGFSPLGEVLSSARNAKKLSLKDVSNNLRLSIGQIEALESNDFLVLPQPMITRGFIRNYARLLEVDAEPLLESYRARMPETLPSGLRVKTSINQVMLGKKSRPWFKYILGSILMLLSLLSWFFYTEYKTKLVPKSAEIVTDVVTKDEVAELVPLPEIALPAAERYLESAETIEPEAVVDEAQGIPNEKGAAVTGALTATPPATAPAQSVQLRPSTDVDFNTLKENSAKSTQTQVAIASKANVMDIAKTNNATAIRENVSLSVSEQTWVRVTDKSGAVIYEKMMAANSTGGFDGQPPFNLLIGNANATTLTFLGKPVDLASKTKNNVARITLE